MKLAATPPSTVSGDLLRAWAEGDSTFDLFHRPHSECVDALREMAWIRPVIVTGERTVVWGFHYRRVWQEFPSVEFPVLVRGTATGHERSMTTVDALRWALTAEYRAGEYRLSELHRVRSLVEREGDVSASWNNLVLLLTGENDPWPVIQRFRALPAPLADAVDNGTIDLRTAEAVPGEYADEVGRFVPLVAPLSVSNRRQAIRMVAELLRGGLDASALAQALSRVSPHAIIEELRHRRYPILSDLEARLKTIQRESLSGTGVALAAPNNFEGDRFHVSFTFRTGSELRARLRAAERLEEHLDELLDLLF